MGAEFIEEFVPFSSRITTPELAYEHLHHRDQYEHGHGGYTGSWAEVPGIRRACPEPMLLAEAKRMASKLDEEGKVHKWEEGLWIAIRSTGSTREIELTVGEEVAAALNGDLRNFEAVEPLCKLGPAESIVNITRGSRQEKRRTVVTATTGKSVTRYFVVFKHGAVMPPWETGYPTQAAARQRMKARLDERATRSGYGPPEELEVVAITRREDGQALVTGLSQLVSSKTQLTVKIASRGTGIRGWLLFALASS